MTPILALMITLGIVSSSLGAMSVINASIEERPSRLAYLFILGGFAAFVMGFIAAPGGISFAKIPHAAIEVIALLVR